jgi:hypothetical protein
MPYEMKPLPCDPTAIAGMSERLIRSHYDNNYGSTVQRLNAITAQLAELDFTKAPIFVINGLKREELIATNSMILHELFFASLGAGGEPDGALHEALARDFKSVANWRSEFAAIGKALRGGSGLAAADLVAARSEARHSVGHGPYDHLGGWPADPGARYVRALLPSRLRGAGRRLCRRLYGGDQLAPCGRGVCRPAERKARMMEQGHRKIARA